MKAKLTSLILIVRAQKNPGNVAEPGGQIGFAQILPPLLCWGRSKTRGQENLPVVMELEVVTGLEVVTPVVMEMVGQQRLACPPALPPSSPFPPFPPLPLPRPAFGAFPFPLLPPFLLLLLMTEICWRRLPASCRRGALEQRGSTTGSCINRT